MEYKKIGKEFFARSPDEVAKDLLGVIIVRKLPNRKILRAKIVEAEAYFDEGDPASRAVQNGDLKETMEMKPGTILVYGIHNNWLVNFVTDSEGKASAVLIRAIEPLNFEGNGSGPGLLTRALSIKKNLHKKSILSNKNIWIEIPKKKEKCEIVSRFRIGVKHDLKGKMRFYIKDNGYVSRK